jgi:gliding motility-associated-like protein
MDFEFGNFTNWQCRTGKVLATGGINNIDWTGSVQVNDRHTIIKAADAKTDLYGKFPEVSPNGKGYSVRLGNGDVYAEAESITYVYDIPVNTATFSISYNYAVVFQNPGHQFFEQPRFRANVYNVTDNVLIDCVSFDFTSAASLPGFKISSVDSAVLYKDWTPVTLDLAVYAGKTIKLEFITSDCTFEAHFGYAYVDVSSNCSGTFNGNIICEGDKTVSLTAPFGFKSYQWFSNNSFLQEISNQQILTLDPLPVAGSIYPLIVTPYPGFGCTDTLYAKIAIAPKPVPNAGADITVCKYEQAQIGTANNPDYSYEWNPVGQLSNPIASNPLAWSTIPGTKELIVKTTDIQTLCYSYDTIVITTRHVDTAIHLSGKNSFCISEPSTAVLSVSSAVSKIQWQNDKVTIIGATSTTYQPSVTGNYWAMVTQNGCTDSTVSIPINIYTGCNYVPTGFTPNGDGLNDTIKPFLFGFKTLKNFSVYNRWGTRIFYSDINGVGWDGTYKGKMLDAGIYVWVLQLTDSTGKTEIQKGTITMIR